MAKKKVEEVGELPQGTGHAPVLNDIAPITETFGGNMDILRDKINEIIARG